MRADEFCRLIGREWEAFEGSLGKLREGEFDEEGIRRVEDLLKALEVEPGECISRELVSLIWFIPTYMYWQEDRVAAKGGNVMRLSEAATRITNTLLVRILGGP